MPGKIYHAVGVDAGGAWTRCVICVLEEGRLRYAGAGLAESRGWVKGRIVDQKAVAGCMLAALRDAESLASVSAESAVVGMGGGLVRGANSRSVIQFGRLREIEQRDVNRAVERASRVHLQEDRMVLQLLPQDFVVDDHPNHRDPRRMTARRLEANVHLVTASVQEHECLVGAVNLAHLSVEETVFEGIAAAYAAVLPEERREGVAVVDIGAHSTELVVYFGEALQLASSLPISGDHFTRDVARGLRASHEGAALVKEEVGCAVVQGTGPNSHVEVPAPEGREAREAPRRVLNGILEARAEELFQFVHREISRVGMDRSLTGGVVLTGGGAKLAGMCDVAERILCCQARNGLAIGIKNWPSCLDEPAWTTAAGLAMYSARLKLHGEIERRSMGLLGRVLR
ncbi:MAG: cell division protein FtsA [Acidobacteria bacterium]|nr:cell division protein FtsA [Acidobacteriota bacterium]